MSTDVFIFVPGMYMQHLDNANCSATDSIVGLFAIECRL